METLKINKRKREDDVGAASVSKKSKVERIIKTSNITIYKESELFSKPLRAQTPTSTAKPDTYFAFLKNKEGESKSVFVKGPYKNKKFADIQVQCDMIKMLLNAFIRRKKCKKSVYMLDHNGSRLTTIIPEIHFLHNRAASVHNDYVNAQTYVIMKDVCNYELCRSKKHTSKTFGQLDVLDKDTSSCRPVESKGFRSDVVNLKILSALFFRYILEINDTCEGNILADPVEGKVYSVDENNYFTGKRPSLFKKFPTQQWIDFINKIMHKYTGFVEELMAFWQAAFKDPSLVHYCNLHKINIDRIQDNINDLKDKKKLKSLFVKN